MSELTSALRRRTEAGTLLWTLIHVGTVTYLESRVRGVTVLLVWHSTKHRPDLLLHTGARVLTANEPEILPLWDVAIRAAKPVTADPELDQKIITGTALMADADGA